MLTAASGPIAEAQRLAAQAWGADASYLLVNGTTVGIQAAVMDTCPPGTALVMPRNAHLSAFNACVLAGCTPVYAEPCCDPRLGVAHHVTPAAVGQACEQARCGDALRPGLPIGAVLVVSPTYFGVTSDIERELRRARRAARESCRLLWLAQQARMRRTQRPPARTPPCLQALRRSATGLASP